MSDNLGRVIRNGLWDQNVVFSRMLALCPAMAVTTSGTNGLGMGLATTAVLVVSNVLVAMIRHTKLLAAMLITLFRVINPSLFPPAPSFRIMPRWKHAARSGSYPGGQG